MKKLMLSIAAIALLLTFTTQAQVYTNSNSEEPFKEVVETEEDYEKIEVSELPEAVTASITRDFVEATTTEAWVKEKDGKSVYKIKLDLNGEEKKLYADAEGNWIDKEDKKKDS